MVKSGIQIPTVMIMKKLATIFFYCHFIIIKYCTCNAVFNECAYIILYHCKSYVLTIFVTVGAWNTQP